MCRGVFKKSFQNFGYVTHPLLPYQNDEIKSAKFGDLLDVIKNKILKYGVINLQNELEHVVRSINVVDEMIVKLIIIWVSMFVVPNEYFNFQNSLDTSGLTTNNWLRPPEH